MSGSEAVTGSLAELAHRYGVATEFTDWSLQNRAVGRDTVIEVLTALGVDASSDETIAAAIEADELAPWRRMLPPVVVATEGRRNAFAVHVPHWNPVEVTVIAEDGTEQPAVQQDFWVDPREVDGVLTGRATFAVPELPPGYHRIRAVDPAAGTTAETDLIVTPARLDTADRFDDRQLWGLAVQLYSTRSAESWGIGDFADLASLAEVSAEQYGADFIQVNPLHATNPVPPVENSPYLPVTRRFVNPLYLRLEDIPEVQALRGKDRKMFRDHAKKLRRLNTDVRDIHRDRIYRAKLEVLDAAFAVEPKKKRAKAFRRFCEEQGDGLTSFATWCALIEKFGADSPKWHKKLTDPDFIARQQRKLADRIEFHAWLQWLCDVQLADAQAVARAAGMEIGVFADLAVGVSRDGADVWALGDVLVSGATVGAPPDAFNQQGQQWNQPPWHPRRLAEQGYRPYRDMLATVLRNAGGIRVDHILGLFRLWWIPAGRSPAEGTYVHYDFDALLGILVLEAQRAGVVVVGEDLGVFEPIVAHTLTQRGVLGTSILWFEHADGAPRPPEDYRRLCLTSVTTHDLPPTRGYLAGEHIDLRDRLGLLELSLEEERRRAAAERDAVLDLARERGLLSDDIDLTDADVVNALHQLIALTPSLLLGVALVDGVGERRVQNQPGTDETQYPNWCIPLADHRGRPVLIDGLAEHAGLAELVAGIRAVTADKTVDD